MMGISRFINLFFFEFILHFVLNVKLNYCIKIEDHNPWLFLMNNYRFHKYHGAGVYSDLGENVTDANNKNYKYAAGRCPVFSKVIKINGKSNFLNKLRRDKVETTKFLLEIQSGKISFTNDSSEGIQFPTVEVEEKYKLWKSPVKRKTIHGCSKYASLFEHFIPGGDGYRNCISPTDGNCIKQSFIYDLKSKMCFILYPTAQENDGNDTNWLYKPTVDTSMNHFVFGSYKIESDWQQTCTSRSVKAAEFGYWNESQKKCESLSTYDGVKTLNDKSLIDCEIFLFENSASDTEEDSYGNGYNWGNYKSNTKECKIFKVLPNCFLFSEHTYALVSTAMKNSSVYAFPPCGAPSSGWNITATCKDNIQKTYTCKDNLWRTSDNVSVEGCESYVSWENVDIVKNIWKDLVDSYFDQDTFNTKPIKGVKLGYWNDACIELNGVKVSETKVMTIDKCMEVLKTKKNNSEHLYGEWNEGRKICDIYKGKPNCLINDKEYITFSLNNKNENNTYVVPPCIEESEAWVIKAECNDNIMKEYVCFNGMWVYFENGVPISHCDFGHKTLELKEPGKIKKHKMLFDGIKIPDENLQKKFTKEMKIPDEKKSAAEGIFAVSILNSVSFFLILLNFF